MKPTSVFRPTSSLPLITHMGLRKSSHIMGGSSVLPHLGVLVKCLWGLAVPLFWATNFLSTSSVLATSSVGPKTGPTSSVHFRAKSDTCPAFGRVFGGSKTGTVDWSSAVPTFTPRQGGMTMNETTTTMPGQAQLDRAIGFIRELLLATHQGNLHELDWPYAAAGLGEAQKTLEQVHRFQAEEAQ
jgi:hypothetical protein